MYWLMLKAGASFPSGASHLGRFSAARNRTELLPDFPDACDPENINAITPHPNEHCFASRSNNHDERSEVGQAPTRAPHTFPRGAPP